MDRNRSLAVGHAVIYGDKRHGSPNLGDDLVQFDEFPGEVMSWADFLSNPPIW